MSSARATTRKLLVVQTLAGLAQWIDIFLIFSVPSFIWHSSPAEIATLAAFLGLPSLLLGPIVGAALDRLDVRSTVIFGAVARTVLTAAIVFAPTFTTFAALVLCKGLANLIYWPSTSILTNRIVPKALRVTYYSSLSAVDQLTKILTPLAVGALAWLFPLQSTFMASAFAGLIGLMLLPSLVSQVAGSATEGRLRPSTICRDLLSGFANLAHLPTALSLSIILSIGASLTLALYDPHLAAFLASRGFDSNVFSMVLSATAAGAVAAAILVRFFLTNVEPARLQTFGLAVFALALMTMAAIAYADPTLFSVAALIALWFVNGFGYEMFAIGSSVVTQNLCPKDMIARITTNIRSMQMLCIVGGPMIGAFLISAASRDLPFIAAAVLAAALATMAIVFALRRNSLSIGEVRTEATRIKAEHGLKTCAGA